MIDLTHGAAVELGVVSLNQRDWKDFIWFRIVEDAKFSGQSIEPADGKLDVPGGPTNAKILATSAMIKSLPGNFITGAQRAIGGALGKLFPQAKKNNKKQIQQAMTQPTAQSQQNQKISSNGQQTSISANQLDSQTSDEIDSTSQEMKLNGGESPVGQSQSPSLSQLQALPELPTDSKSISLMDETELNLLEAQILRKNQIGQTEIEPNEMEAEAETNPAAAELDEAVGEKSQESNSNSKDIKLKLRIIKSLH